MKRLLNGWSPTKIDIKKVNQLLIFLIKLNVFLIPLYLISFFNWNLFFLQEVTASVVTWFLNFTGVPAVLEGVNITIPLGEGSFSGFISWDCTAWKSIIAFLALLFASNVKELKALLFIPVIFLLNIVRIWAVFLLTYLTNADYFSLVHGTLWSFGMIVLVLLFWVYSYKKWSE